MQAAFASVPLQLLIAYADGRFNTFGMRSFMRKNMPRIAHLSAQEYEKEGSAEALNKVTDDLSQVREYFGSTLPYHICLIVYAVVPLFYLLYENLLLATICYTVIPLVIVGMNRLLRPIKKLIGEYSQNRASAMQNAQEAIAQIMTVKAMGLDTFTGKLPTLLIITIGAILVLNGQITVAALIVFNNLGRQGQRLTGVMGQAITAFKGSETRLDRIYELADRTKESDEGMELQTRHAGSIDVVGLNFGYTQEKPVLRDLSLSLNRGEFAVLMGESGCGKSTLMRLLLKMTEQYTGHIVVDPTSLREIRASGWRKRIAFVPQFPFLFAGTLRENLTLGRECEEDAIWEALRLAGFEQELGIFEEGLDTRIERGGMNFSGGQRQRIELARAILREGPILLLDETTSALDAATEERLLRNLKQLSREKAVLMISHRPAAAKAADRILLMSGGSIAEEGTHDALMRERGAYFALYSSEMEATGDET